MEEPANTFDLSREQQDSAILLQRLLGKAIADRYVDFCRLAAGAFALRVSRPMAAHALRELISAASIVADRLKFLHGLNIILFDFETKARLKERIQLHKIVEQNTWIFGEEYNLWASDKDLTAVLKAHKEKLDPEVIIDELPGSWLFDAASRAIFATLAITFRLRWNSASAEKTKFANSIMSSSSGLRSLRRATTN